MNRSIVYPHNDLSSFEDSQGLIFINKSVLNNKILSSEASVAFQWLFAVVLGALVGILGIVTNVINIIVFVKQRAHKECGTVNLLGLAVSDLCVAITMLFLSFSYCAWLLNPPNLPWEPFAMAYLPAGWPHLMFVQITRTITAYIAFERCMCVVFPFKVKSMLSPKRSIVIIASIFLCFFSSFSPAFIKQKLVYNHDPIVNRSRIVLVLASDWQFVVDIMWYINSIVFNIGSVAIVLICTVITASRVQLSKTWRSSIATGNEQGSEVKSKPVDKEEKPKSGNTSNQNVMSNSKMQKEKKLISMIVLISVIFLICYIPDFMFLLMYSINPDIRIMGKYHNTAVSMYVLTFFMGVFNSSINIIVYYKMSSKYKTVFREWIGISKDEKSVK